MSQIKCKKCGHGFNTVSPGTSVETFGCPICGTNNAPHANAEVPPPTEIVLSATSTDSGQSATAVRSMCDWEANWRSDTLGALVRTAKDILTDPIEYFGRVKPAEDYLSLAIWLYVFTFINLFFSMVYQLVWGMIFNPKEALFTIPIMLCGSLFAPFVVMLILGVSSAILHFFLVNIGGSKKPFNTTLTVYVLGSVTGIFSVVPILGGLVAMVYGIIINILGMAQAHEIPASRVFLSFLVPALIAGCCVGIGAMIIAFAAGGLAQLAN